MDIIPADSGLDSFVEYTAIGLIVLLVVVNFGVMATLSGKKLCLSLKKRAALKRHKKALEERELAKSPVVAQKALFTIKEEDSLVEHD